MGGGGAPLLSRHLKAKKIAIVGDTTGYGTTASRDSVADFQKAGANVVYHDLIEATKTDVTSDMLRMQDSGAKVVVPWSVTTGMLARLLNVRGALRLERAVRRPSRARLRRGEEAARKAGLLGEGVHDRLRSCSYDANGKLPPRTQAFVDRLRARSSSATPRCGGSRAAMTRCKLVAEAIEKTGSTEPEAIIGYWNTLKAYPGVFGNYTFTPEEHNGYPDRRSRDVATRIRSRTAHSSWRRATA